LIIRTFNSKLIFIKLLFKYLLISIPLLLISKNSVGATNTYNWRGATSTAGNYLWTTPSNWYLNNTTTVASTYPGQSSSTDIVDIDVNYAATNQPTLNATLPNSVASITFGPGNSPSYNNSTGLYIYPTITLNVTGVTLTTGSIIQNHATGVYNYYANFVTTLTGTGTVVCTGNLQVGVTTIAPTGTSATLTDFSSQITQLTIDGNLVLNATGDGPSGNAQNYPVFNLDNNKVTLVGQFVYTTTNSPTSNLYGGYNSNDPGIGKFSMNNNTNTTTLELLNITPINTFLTDMTVDFDNGGGGTATTIYDATSGSQKVYSYADNPNIGHNPDDYQNLTLSGASTKIFDGTSVNIGNALNSSGGTVNWANNNPAITIGGTWTNSANVSQGSGAITCSGNLDNSTGTITLASGGLTLGGSINNTSGNIAEGSGAVTVGGSVIITTGTISGNTTSATTTVGGSLTNSGTLTCNAENMTFASGANNSTITGGAGKLTFNGTYANNAGSITTGAGTATFTGAYTNSSGASFTGGSGSVYYTSNYTNSGTFTAGSGTVYFNKNGTQTLLDNSAAGTTFNNVTFDSTTGTNTTNMTSGSGNFAVSSSGLLTMGSSAILTAGATTAGGTAYLTLKSNASGSASVANIPSGSSIAGNVNVLRYMTGGTSTVNRSYRLLTSPVNNVSPTSGSSNYISFGNLKISYTLNGTTYYGVFTGGPTGTGFSITNANPTIYLYNETLNPTTATKNAGFTTGKNVGLTSIAGTSVGTTSTINGVTSTVTVQVPAGNGFIMYYIGSTNGRASGSTALAPDFATINNVGFINQQNVKVDLWYAPTGGTLGNSYLSYTSALPATNYPGYDMVGNPYASTIDLKKLYTDNYVAASNAISSNFYELNDVNPGQTYVVYSATGGNSGSVYSEYVASGQGFFCVAAGTSQSLTFMEDQKIYNTALLNSTSTPPILLSLHTPAVQDISHDALTGSKTDAIVAPQDTLTGLHLMLQQDSVINHQCGIYFCKHCSDNFDINDAYDLDGINPAVFMSSFTADNVRTALNKFGDYIPHGKRVKLFVKATTDGLYKLTMTDFQNIDTADYNIYLVDNLNKDSLDMVHYKTYNFSLSTADTASFANRFVLAVERKPLPPYQLITFTGQKVTGGAQLNWKTYNEGDYTGFVLQKMDAATKTFGPIDSLQSNSATNYSFVDHNPVSGSNVYRLQQNDINGNITYSALVTINYNSLTVDGTFTVYPNPSRELITVSVNSTSTNTPAAYVSKIYNTAGAVIGERNISANSWTEDISNYKAGVYIIVLKDNNGNMVGKTKFVKTN
jgi:hypothetical protein